MATRTTSSPRGATLNYTIDITDDSGVNATLTAGDFTNAGSASISIGTIASAPIAGGVRYTVPVTALSAGTIILTIASTASITDDATNAVALPVSDNDSVTVDAIAPTVTVNQAAGQADPTNVQNGPLRGSV